MGDATKDLAGQTKETKLKAEAGGSGISNDE
jgi:hypothetical protein